MLRADVENRAFTLIELMVVMALIGVLATTTTIRLDLFGTERSQELERLMTFVRTQHARSMRKSHPIYLRIDSNQNRLTAELPDHSRLQTMTLSRWSITGASADSIKLTPWAVNGHPLHLETGRESMTLVTDSTLALRRKENP